MRNSKYLFGRSYLNTKHVLILFCVIINCLCGCGRSEPDLPIHPLLDPSFGYNGIIVLDGLANEPLSSEQAYDVIIDAEDKVLIAGYTSTSATRYDMVLVRLLSDGTLDPTFNNDGIVTHHNAAGGDNRDMGHSLMIDSSDRIIVSGKSKGVIDSEFALWRFLADGSFDVTFNGQGYCTYYSSIGIRHPDYDGNFALTSAGQFVTAGWFNNSPDDKVFVSRINDDGALDTGFGPDGFVTIPGTGDVEYVRNIMVDSSGRILIIGRSAGNMFICRLTESGILDSTFNGTGILVYNGLYGSEAQHIAEDQSGKLVLAGLVENGVNADLAVWRVNDNGTWDTSFHIDGVATHDSAAGGVYNDVGYHITFDANEKIIASGYSDDLMAIWRFNVDGTLDTTFNEIGYIISGHFTGYQGFDNSYASIVLLNGDIISVGTTVAIHGFDIFVARFLTGLP